jgi:PleD family two-component response regulator
MMGARIGRDLAGAIQICIVCDDAKQRALLVRASRVHVDGVATRINHVTSVTELHSEEPGLPDLVILDCTTRDDAEHYISTTCKTIFHSSVCIVVCNKDERDTLQDLVLEGTVFDYLVLEHGDAHYLKTQVWRAIRACVELPFRQHAKGNAAEAAVERVTRARRLAAAPLAAPLPGAPAAAFEYDPEAQPFLGMTALVIEEDLPSATLLSDYLTLAGFEVLCSNSVGHACRYHREQPVDIVLTELFLPGVSGPRVVRMIREHFRQSGLPIVVVSAYSDVQIVRACIKEGISDFLLKPLRRSTLVTRLAPLLLGSGTAGAGPPP